MKETTALHSITYFLKRQKVHVLHCILQKEEMAVKEIDIPFAIPIPILIENTFTEFKYSSFGIGYHVYKDVWTPIISDDSLTCKQEKHNENDKNAVAIIWGFIAIQELQHGRKIAWKN